MTIYGKKSAVRVRRKPVARNLRKSEAHRYVYYGSSSRTVSRNLATDIFSWIRHRKALTRQTVRVVDFGCGDGRTAERLARTLGGGVDVIGVDNSPVSRLESRRHARFVESDFSDSLRYFPPRSLDLAYSHYGVYHYDFIHHSSKNSSLLFLERLVKKMRPGGMIVINAPLWDPYLRNRYLAKLRSCLPGCHVTKMAPQFTFFGIIRKLFRGSDDAIVLRIIVP
jgi:SAM-dependent methyltransferase